MRTVLLTAIGGDIAQGVARIIRLARPDWRLLGTDIHAQHAGHLFVDAFFFMPPASSPEYLPKLEAMIAAHQVNAVIPMSEPELIVLADVCPSVPDVDWIGPGASVIRCGADKLATARSLAAIGLSPPWTVDASREMPVEYPCIYKPRFGAGGRGVVRIGTPDEASAMIGRGLAVFQELLLPDESEITCAVYRTREGQAAVLQMRRRLVDSVTGWAKVIYDKSVESHCLAIAEGLGLQGSMNVQLRITAAGPKVFEINPRYSSTTWMRHLVGFTDVVWALDELDGIPVQIPKIQAGIEMARTHDAGILPAPTSV